MNKYLLLQRVQYQPADLFKHAGNIFIGWQGQIVRIDLHPIERTPRYYIVIDQPKTATGTELVFAEADLQLLQ